MKCSESKPKGRGKAKLKTRRLPNRFGFITELTYTVHDLEWLREDLEKLK